MANVSLAVTDSPLEDAQLVALRGALDLDSVGLLEDVIARVWTPAITAMTIDLSELTFIDSCGLWTITTVNKWCTRGKVKLELIPGPESVHSVFELTGLSDVLPFGKREGHRASAIDRRR